MCFDFDIQLNTNNWLTSLFSILYHQISRMFCFEKYFKMSAVTRISLNHVFYFNLFFTQCLPRLSAKFYCILFIDSLIVFKWIFAMAVECKFFTMKCFSFLNAKLSKFLFFVKYFLNAYFNFFCLSWYRNST